MAEEGGHRDNSTKIHSSTFQATPESGEDENALLMAAVAMTEFGQSPPPNSSMLSPDTIRTYNPTPSGDDDNDGTEVEDTFLEEGDDEDPIHRTSKRSINFDEIRSTPSKGRKKVKAG